MVTEKICVSGIVTAECLTGALGGPQVVFDAFIKKLCALAHSIDMVVVTRPKPRVVLPLYESWYYGNHCVKVYVTARAVKVTRLPAPADNVASQKGE